MPGFWAPGTPWLGLTRSCRHIQDQWCWCWWNWWCSPHWISSLLRGMVSLEVWEWWWTSLCLLQLHSGVQWVIYPHLHTYLINTKKITEDWKKNPHSFISVYTSGEFSLPDKRSITAVHGMVLSNTDFSDIVSLPSEIKNRKSLRSSCSFIDPHHRTLYSPPLSKENH